jgi:hypothetical protein
MHDFDHVAGIYTIPVSISKLIQILDLIQLPLAITFMPFLLVYSYFMIKHLKNLDEKKWIITLVTIISSLVFAFLIIYITGLLFQYNISAAMSILALLATFLIHWTAYIGVFKYKLAKNKDAIDDFLNNDSTISYDKILIVENNIPEEFKESITENNLYFQN